MNASLHPVNLVWLTVGVNPLDVNLFSVMFSTLNGNCAIGVNLCNKIGSFSFVVKFMRIKEP